MQKSLFRLFFDLLGWLSGGLSACGDFDAEGCADADFRRFDVDTSAVIFLDDAFCKRQSEAPAATLGGKARVEHVLEVFARDAFAGVGDVDKDAVGIRCYGDAQRAFALHGVDSIFRQVFHHPFEQRRAEHHAAVFVGQIDA